MANLEEIPDPLVTACQHLLKQFVQRRLATVIQAVIDLRPDLIIEFDFARYYPINEADVKTRAEIVQAQIRAGTYAWEGIWNNEWMYRLHGHGCELIHQKTYERYDWDVGDPYGFFTGQFALYLRWIVNTSPENPAVSIYRDWRAKSTLDLAVLLGYLVEKHILATRYPHEWKLLS